MCDGVRDCPGGEDELTEVCVVLSPSLGEVLQDRLLTAKHLPGGYLHVSSTCCNYFSV